MKAIGFLQWMVLSIAAVPLLVEEGPFVYVDWQESSSVGGPFQRLYRPSNSVHGGPMIQSEDFATGLQSILDTLADAKGKGTRVQAFGSKWTFNNLSYVQESMVDSTGLNYCQIGMNSSHLMDAFVDLADHLVFVQAGVRIKELNRALTEKNLALSTSGASDGQRVAGAMSTGTHGSRFAYGSMDRMIRAIHIVTDSNQHVLLQGQAAVVNQEFASYLGGATWIQDAELFNMAKICFGSCGIIHGYVLEVEPLYYLRYSTRKYSFTQVENVINTLDVSGLDGIKDTFTNPSMISVGLNLFQTGAGSATVTVYEVTQQQFLQDNRQVNSEGAVSPFLLHLLELILGVVNKPWVRAIDKTLFGGALVYAVHQFIVTQALAMQDGDETIAIDIPSRIFGNPDSESGLEGVYPDIPQYIGKVTNSEMFVPLERTTDALNIIQRQLRDDPILLFVFLRFVKKSSSTLSAAIFNTTTTIDMISIQDEGLFSRTSGWFERLFVEFETSGIPHSYHWGKRFPLNNRWVPNAYGEDLTEWQDQRRMLLGGNEAMFRNDAMDQLAVL